MDKKHGEPFINIWFGNFYEPAFSDRAFIERAISDIGKMGFNNVMLDSKSWEDFFARYDGEEASPYVEMQEYMIGEIKKWGLAHNFLAIYLNGDNLYPHIRFSPPILGEAVTGPDGREKRWYKYWSGRAQSVMTEHVKGLFRLYSDNYSELDVNGEKRLPLCSMWDPIVEPSFDQDGVERYLTWLAGNYHQDIGLLNRAYGTAFSCFADIRPQDYWFQLKYGDEFLFTREDVESMAPPFLIRADNMKWKRHEFREYFKVMKARFRELDPRLYLSPNISQWSVFLNINGSQLSGVSFGDLWDTANRGIDPYEIENYVDNCSFTTVPTTSCGDADAYVVSCQNSMIRCMNRGRDFAVGLFLGRFLYNDVYRYVTPAEVIAAAAASGAKGYNAYGYCGMDDGGILHRMDDCFKESIRVGNEWAKKVIPLLGGRKKSRVAILYPAAMALIEPLAVEGNEERRLDLLGWYKSACDAGFAPDVLHPRQVAEGVLDGYEILVLPANDCYKADRNPGAEEALKNWVHSGGILIHGPCDQLAELVTGLRGERHDRDCMYYQEGILLTSTEYCSYMGDTTIARYGKDRKGCIVENSYGAGKVYSFGFQYGYSYVARILPHVPQEQGNKELYPIRYANRDPYQDILTACGSPNPGIRGKDIETALFENGAIIINHSSYPFDVSGIKGKKIFQYELGTGILLPHSAVFLGLD
jgi:hypothetical protein